MCARFCLATVVRFRSYHRKAFDPGIDRHGFCADPTPESPLPEPFAYVVGPTLDEKWSEGLVVFHNPAALAPIPSEFFTGAVQYWRKGNDFKVTAPDFFPHMSVTANMRCKDGDVTPKFEEFVDTLAEYFAFKTQLGDSELAQTYAQHAELLKKAGLTGA